LSDQIRKIQEYIYARYVDQKKHGTIDEEAAIRVLEQHYRQPANVDDSECCYLGILYFERGFGFDDDTKRIEYFRRAKRWFARSKALLEEPWDAVDDRLADIAGFFEDAGVPADVADADLAPPEAPPSNLPKEIDVHGPMVLVAAGPYLFGPRRETRTSAAFYIDKHPVTNRQYGAFCRATQYRWPKHWETPRFNGPDHPVVGVSAADAAKYCKWAGKDLPTEEQWEKAARGSDGRLYPWGDTPPVRDVACFGRDPEAEGTTPVTAHPAGASPVGALDLAGNVWEWTATAIEDGEAFQVVKGGCYSDPAEILRADGRLEAGPKDKFENIGFRCVKPA
jgi:hypothetical protein